MDAVPTPPRASPSGLHSATLRGRVPDMSSLYTTNDDVVVVVVVVVVVPESSVLLLDVLVDR
jgi:hypothetical protein